MPAKAQLADFAIRIAAVRKNTLGIFDPDERKMLLDLVADVETLIAKEKARRGR